jgi:hypothetical protein
MSAPPFYRCPPLAHASLPKVAGLLFVASFIGTGIILGTQQNDIPANGDNAGPPIRQLTAADYARAEKVLDFNLKSSVKNAQIVAQCGTIFCFWRCCCHFAGWAAACVR